MEKDSLKVTTIRKMRTMKAQQTEMIIYVRERWDLIENGETLKYSKTVELPAATDDVVMYFTKDSK